MTHGSEDESLYPVQQVLLAQVFTPRFTPCAGVVFADQSLPLLSSCLLVEETHVIANVNHQ